MANPVNTTDIEARWRPLTSSEATVAQSLLDDAWAIVTARVPDLETRLIAVPPEVDSGLVVSVVAAMVLRVLKNPAGILSQSIDDFSYTRDRAISSGALYLSDDELALLLDPDLQSAAFTIVPYGVPGYRADQAETAWRPW